MVQNGSRHSSKDTDLGTSITLIPLSTYLSSDKAELFIFKDEKLAMERASDGLARSYFISALMILFIVGLTAYITYRTFGGITRAIAVLEGLTQGDHTQKMP